jgi:hypothetical protein
MPKAADQYRIGWVSSTASETGRRTFSPVAAARLAMESGGSAGSAVSSSMAPLRSESGSASSSLTSRSIPRAAVCGSCVRTAFGCGKA